MENYKNFKKMIKQKIREKRENQNVISLQSPKSTIRSGGPVFSEKTKKNVSKDKFKNLKLRLASNLPPSFNTHAPSTKANALKLGQHSLVEPIKMERKKLRKQPIIITPKDEPKPTTTTDEASNLKKQLTEMNIEAKELMANSSIFKFDGIKEDQWIKNVHAQVGLLPYYYKNSTQTPSLLSSCDPSECKVYNLLRQAELMILSDQSLDEQTRNSLEIITLNNFSRYYESVGFKTLADQYLSVIIKIGDITEKAKWMLKSSVGVCINKDYEKAYKMN